LIIGCALRAEIVRKFELKISQNLVIQFSINFQMNFVQISRKATPQIIIRLRIKIGFVWISLDRKKGRNHFDYSLFRV